MPITFPEPISPRYAPPLTYPSNLKAGSRNYFTRIKFIKYKPAYGTETLNTVGGFIKETVIPAFETNVGELVTDIISLVTPFDEFLPAINNAVTNYVSGKLSNLGVASSTIIDLPIPKKINEMNMMGWSEISLMGTILGSVSKTLLSENAAGIGSTILQLGSSFGGAQLNPFIMQYFQRPALREFSFTWTLAPRNEKESEEINKIIYEIKAAQAPRSSANEFLMEYPDLAIIEFHPIDKFQIELKECIIIGVNVDYTPAGPSYFSDSEGKSTAAPTLVNITMNLRETKFWWSQEWRDRLRFSSIDAAPPGVDAARAGLPEVTS